MSWLIRSEHATLIEKLQRAIARLKISNPQAYLALETELNKELGLGEQVEGGIEPTSGGSPNSPYQDSDQFESK